MKVGEAASRTVTLQNTSDVAVRFQMDAEARSPFEFSRTSGEVPPGRAVTWAVAFRPREAASYYKRVTVLLQARARAFLFPFASAGACRRFRSSPLTHRRAAAACASPSRPQGPTTLTRAFTAGIYRSANMPSRPQDTSPLAFDLLATSFTEKQRPPGLEQAHVDAARVRAAQAAGAQGTPEEIAEREWAGAALFDRFCFREPACTLSADEAAIDFGCGHSPLFLFLSAGPVFALAHGPYPACRDLFVSRRLPLCVKRTLVRSDAS